ncbi:MAG TPA: tRNA uridine-5-carboxymethylaminomethyl(34) synthesis GTPase MnmE [Candidatus Binataceae bacterium]|nr:tRNA uridine-5-carboxymethylaminomethyl(34) synthesis GTPase MnmE [Candidatus Binataceae bacterium]
MYQQDTIVAPATPPGRGAVAIVRLSGPRAIEILHRLWRPVRETEMRPRRLYLGEIRDRATGAAIDRALAVIMTSPASLTGEDVVELQCHGGAFLVRRVIGLAIAEGARMAERGEFSRRAFLNGRIDLTEAEAVADLVSAQGEGALQQALSQLGGALKQRVCRLRRAVIGVKAHLEVEIDFSDEHLALPSRDEIGAQLERLAEDVRILHDSFARGRLMREGARAAIIGKPNAGKSTILNLLLGIERAIVTPYPGTTRDVIEDSIQLGPYPLVLQDTAGIRDGADPVERIGVERALHHAGEADLLIAVFDSSRPLEAEDLRVVEACGSRPGVALLNKSDLPAQLALESLREQGLRMPALAFSALRAEGVARLRDELARTLDALAGDHRGDAVSVSRERHRRALAGALAALEAARASARDGMPPEIVAVDVAIAADALGSITGEVSSEDVLDAVFAEFCIGK